MSLSQTPPLRKLSNVIANTASTLYKSTGPRRKPEYIELHVAGASEVFGYTPKSHVGNRRIVACTVVVKPRIPITIGDSVALFAVYPRDTPTASSTLDFTYRAEDPSVYGRVSGIVGIEKFAITFLVTNLHPQCSTIAFAHVSIKYVPAVTFHLPFHIRFAMAVQRDMIPDSRRLPLIDNAPPVLVSSRPHPLNALQNDYANRVATTTRYYHPPLTFPPRAVSRNAASTSLTTGNNCTLQTSLPHQDTYSIYSEDSSESGSSTAAVRPTSDAWVRESWLIGDPRLVRIPLRLATPLTLTFESTL